MVRLGITILLMALAMLPALPSAEQSQTCPVNINFSSGTLDHWQAYTGNNMNGNGPDAIIVIYDSTRPAPAGTIGATGLPEYNLPGVTGVRVVTSQGNDPFGGFPMIPTINGYAYQYSVLLGSTSVAQRMASDPTTGQPANQVNTPRGGYVRGIRYLINVPPGPATHPYTITYAYAMVLENGTHISLEQPMSRAIVSTPAGIIACASPEYYLPTDDGIVDSAVARANGFSPSPVPSPNEVPSQPNSGQSTGQHLADIWTKGWTEVNFDLSQYRGQQVTLTFEADNCVPGGHFAYAYFALRDVCAGLRISGDTIACTNSIVKYYIPSLDSASYTWSAPVGWVISPGSNANTITVKAGPQPGYIVATEKNSCTTLTDSLLVHLYPGALPQAAIDPQDTTICSGAPVTLHALVTAATEYTWINPPGLIARRNKDTITSLPFAIDAVAAPVQSTDYILNFRNAGCPITVTDTFAVTVVPPIQVNPGKDTIVVVDQPLHFQATSSDIYPDTYQWSPSTNLSDPGIADPIGLYGSDMNTITYLVTATDTFGCYGTATVSVTIAHTLPDIFVPNAFTPGTNSNSLFRPVCMGIASLEYFRVYNRWGQLMFSTTQMGKGWDGRIQGTLQETNSYLWIVKGTDYTGKVISKRGTMLLIR